MKSPQQCGVAAPSQGACQAAGSAEGLYFTATSTGMGRPVSDAFSAGAGRIRPAGGTRLAARHRVVTKVIPGGMKFVPPLSPVWRAHSGLFNRGRIASVHAMSLPDLSGAQKTRLRGLGQTLADGAWLGGDGVSATFVAELQRQLERRELVKLRFTAGHDRHERAALCAQIEREVGCVCVGAVGKTALFWRPGPEGSRLLAD